MYLNPRWIIALGMALILCSIVSNTIEMASPVGTNETSVYSVVTGFTTLNFQDPMKAIGTVFQLAPGAVALLFKMMLWDYSFFEVTGDFLGPLIRILLLCMSFGVMIALVVVFRQMIRY